MIAYIQIGLRLLVDLVPWPCSRSAPGGRSKLRIWCCVVTLRYSKERGVKPWRIDAATRVSLSLLTRLCDWRSCLIIVRPEALIRWHRAGRRQQWRYLSRPGRPPIPLELRQLVRRLTAQNELLARSGLPMNCCRSSVSGSLRVPCAGTCRSNRQVVHAVIGAGRRCSRAMPRQLPYATSSWRSRRRSDNSISSCSLSTVNVDCCTST